MAKVKTNPNPILQRIFGFDSTKHSVWTEIGAGLTTFVTMAYVLAVNPSIMLEAGMDKSAVFTATAIAAALGTLFCALIAKLPFAQAPAMGAISFFTYTVCVSMGYSWQFALTGVFLEGILFIIFSVTGLREWIVNILPEGIRLGIGAGIGVFIAFLGLKNGQIVVASPATFVTVGDLIHGDGLLALIGLLLMSVLIIHKVRGALLIGVVVTTLIGIPMGITHLAYEWVSLPPSMMPIFFQFEWDKVFTIDMLIVVLTLLSMDLFDTLGTILSLTHKTGKISQKSFNRALLCDALATTTGACLGTSTVGTYVESSAGIQAGGRTGLTSFVTALLFLSALFVAPIFLSIPSAAIAPALILVGISMLGGMTSIFKSEDLTEIIPAVITTIMIPFTFSIANGIILGLISYCVVNILTSGFKKVSWQLLILTALISLRFVL